MFRCPDGFWYNPKNGICDYKENVPEGVCEDNECEVGKVYFRASKISCTSYIMCFDGTAVTQECPEGQEFDVDKCVLAKDSKCAFKCPVDDENPFTFHQNTKDCQKYYICVKGVPTGMSCADGLHWNQDTEKCIKEEDSNCVSELF